MNDVGAPFGERLRALEVTTDEHERRLVTVEADMKSKGEDDIERSRLSAWLTVILSATSGIVGFFGGDLLKWLHKS